MKKVQSKENPEIIGTLKVLTKHDNIIDQIIVEQGYTKFYYDNLTDLYDKWKDYEEPKGTALYWMILTLENFIENEPDNRWIDLDDCKQMLKKLKAWQRLKDKGFRFKGYTDDSGDLFSCQVIRCNFDDFGKESRKDLNLLFGGKK